MLVYPFSLLYIFEVESTKLHRNLIHYKFATFPLSRMVRLSANIRLGIPSLYIIAVIHVTISRSFRLDDAVAA